MSEYDYSVEIEYPERALKSVSSAIRASQLKLDKDTRHGLLDAEGIILNYIEFLSISRANGVEYHSLSGLAGNPYRV